MKFILAALVLSLSTLSFASSEEAIKAFEKNKSVKTKIAALEKKKFSKIEEASAILLEGQCGVAGCSQDFIVGQTMGTTLVNRSTTSVLALVRKSPVGDSYTVQMISAEDILRLAR